MREPSAAIAKQGWSKDLADCDDRIIAGYTSSSTEFLAAHKDLWMRPDYAWRSPAFQFTLFQKGRELRNGVWVLVDEKLKVTDQDGTVKRSHHNVYPSQALDFIIFRGKVPLWASSSKENAALYIEMGNLLAKRGLISGAVWKYNWKDPGHVQVAYSII